MKIIHHLLSKIYIIYIIFNPLLLFAQENKWTTKLADDGNSKVVYAIYDSINVNGEEVTFIEYSAKTKTSASLERCAEVFNNPDMHNKFYEYTEVSDKIKDISVNEWIIYYYYSPPWPIADSDCVSKITMTADSANSKIIFSSISDANLIEKKDVTRLKLNDITFTFTNISNNEVEIFIEAKLIPATQAPKWMMNGWFPDGPVGILSRFKKITENL